MYLKTTAVSLVAAAALFTSPALAAKPAADAHGKAASPAQLCKSESKKKTNRGKGKSPFTACVIGAKRANADATAKRSKNTAPGRLCKDHSRKKTAADKKSPFAACVVGAKKAQEELASS